jgi:hypothetical protein
VCPLLIIYKDRERVDDVIGPVDIWIEPFLPQVTHRRNPMEKIARWCGGC